MSAAVVPVRPSSSLIVDGVTLLALVAFIPFSILAIGLPFALAIRFVLWLVELFGPIPRRLKRTGERPRRRATILRRARHRPIQTQRNTFDESARHTANTTISATASGPCAIHPSPLHRPRSSDTAYVSGRRRQTGRSHDGSDAMGKNSPERATIG